MILHLKHTKKDQRASTAAKSINNSGGESSTSYSFSLLIGGGGDSELKVEGCNGYLKAIRDEVAIVLAAMTARSMTVNDDFFNLYLSSNPFPLSLIYFFYLEDLYCGSKMLPFDSISRGIKRVEGIEHRVFRRLPQRSSPFSKKYSVF